MSDDNFGMYVTVPTDSIRNVLVPKHNPNLHASLAIGIVPADVKIPGYFVEQATALLGSKIVNLTTPTPDNRWFVLLKGHGQKLVCRTLMMQKDRYVAAMRSCSDEHGRRLSAAELTSLEGGLPGRFWVTEVTLPNLYTGNKRKLGDIVTLISPTQQQYQSNEMVLFCWLPGMMWNSAGLTQPPQSWSLFGHVPLLRDASKAAPVLEW